MNKAMIMALCLILTGTSFIIMSLGCIKNKYVVIAGALLFITALVLFLVGFNDIIFVDTKKIGG